MKIALASLTLLATAACSQPATTTADKAGEVPGNTAAVAANTRPDGSIIDESKPHEHNAANAHSEPAGMAEPMDMAMMTPAAGDSAATKGYKSSMTKMMQGMPPYTGDADVDFNKQMRTHHLAAIDMGEVLLANGNDAESRALATKIVADQKREVAQIDGWLAKRGQ